MNRYVVFAIHGESKTIYNVSDTSQPNSEQPCIIIQFTTDKDWNAKYLADDFCHRHNSKEVVNKNLTKVK